MKLVRKSLLLSIVLFSMLTSVNAQPFEHAGQYLDHITKAKEELTTKYLVYLSASAHGKSLRKVEKRRVEVVNAISDTRYNVMGMGTWKGDKTLRDTTVAYLKILNTVFNEDYGKLVNMEEIAEQSYDAMEAYLLAQEKAYEKLDEASKKQYEMQKQFAAKYNINLIEQESEIGAKSKTASEVMHHHNEVYLVFFKSYKQEAYLMDAISKKNLVSIEQSLSALAKFSEEGKKKLQNMTGYKADNSLIASGIRMMEHYKWESTKGPAITDYFLKEEEFNKIKKQLETKPESKRTQEDVDKYNKAVNDINAVLNTFNSTMSEVSKKSNAALNDWNKTSSKYLDEHMPRQQRN
jgi:hypothetical protein